MVEFEEPKHECIYIRMVRVGTHRKERSEQPKDGRGCSCPTSNPMGFLHYNFGGLHLDLSLHPH